MPVPTIYYIRHGETSWNAEGRLQGTLDIPLNELGRRQAAKAGGILGDLFARDGRQKHDLAYVASPLGRARTTMEFVREVLGLPADQYALDDRLREIGYGRWEGSTLAEMRAQDPDLYARRQTEKWTMSPPGGETYAAVQVRMQDWYDSLKSDTVAVAHGGTARALLVLFGASTPAEAPQVDIGQGVVYRFTTSGVGRHG